MNRRELLGAALSAPLALAFAPRLPAAARGGSPLALVTADAESHLVAVSLWDGSVVKRVATPAGPRSIESWLQTTAVVAHTEAGLVSVVDGVTLTLRHVIRGFDEPRYAAARPGTDMWGGSEPIAYVSDSAWREVVTVDLVGGAIVHRTRVAGPARHITISPDGASVWTSLGSGAARIAVLDVRNARRPRLISTIEPPFPAHDVVFAPDGAHVWVTSGSRRRIAVYEAASAAPPRVLAADAAPQHVAFAGGRALVASGDDGTVQVHAHDGRPLGSARVPVGSCNITFGWQRAVTPSLERGTVCLLDAAGRVRATRRLARTAHDACVVVSA